MPTILIVDDEPSMLSMLSRILVGALLKVITAASVSEAEERLAEEEVDIVLSDVYLQGPSGLELLKQLRASRPELPVILMSGAMTPELTRDAARAGAYDIISKPFDPGELLLLLARAVRQSQRMV